MSLGAAESAGLAGRTYVRQLATSAALCGRPVSGPRAAFRRNLSSRNLTPVAVVRCPRMRRRDVWATAIFISPRWACAAATSARSFRLGVLAFSDSATEAQGGAVFAAELAKQGFVLGSNLVIERRFSHMDGLDSAASALAALKVDVIYARGTQAALAAKRATSSIPIVFMSADPVGFGLVSSLPRPGGNLTGVSIQGPAITAKEMEAMLGALGTLRSLAYIHPIGARAVPWYPSYVGAATCGCEDARRLDRVPRSGGRRGVRTSDPRACSPQDRCGRANARYSSFHAHRPRI